MVSDFRWDSNFRRWRSLQCVGSFTAHMVWRNMHMSNPDVTLGSLLTFKLPHSTHLQVGRRKRRTEMDVSLIAGARYSWCRPSAPFNTSRVWGSLKANLSIYKQDNWKQRSCLNYFRVPVSWPKQRTGKLYVYPQVQENVQWLWTR